MVERVPWLDYLVNHIGLKEIPGPQNNELIVRWGKDAGIGWWNNDEDAWCAVALNGALVNSGYPSTRSALARSFVRYGTGLKRPVRGAIVVFPRGSNPLYGHAGFVEDVNADGTITVVSGNLDNMVKRSVFRTASILPDGIRWPPGAPRPGEAAEQAEDQTWGERSLRVGSRGGDVEALQRDLNRLGFALEVDGIFGGRTMDAVRQFEARRGLSADGIADPAMLAALTSAVESGRARKDRRDAATKAATPVAGAGAAVTVGAAVTSGAEIAREVNSLNNGTLLGFVLIALLVAGVGGFLVWRYAIRRAEGELVEDRL